MKKIWLTIGMALLGLTGIGPSTANAQQFGDFPVEIGPPPAVDPTGPCGIVYEKLDTLRECPSESTCIDFQVTLTRVGDSCRIDGNTENWYRSRREESFNGFKDGESILLSSALEDDDRLDFSHLVSNTSEFNDYDYFQIKYQLRLGISSQYARINFDEITIVETSGEISGGDGGEGEVVGGGEGGTPSAGCEVPGGWSLGCIGTQIADPDMMTVVGGGDEEAVEYCLCGDRLSCVGDVCEVIEPGAEGCTHTYLACHNADEDIVLQGQTTSGVSFRSGFPLDGTPDQDLRGGSTCQLNPSAAPQEFSWGWLALFGLALAGLRTKWKSNE